MNSNVVKYGLVGAGAIVLSYSVYRLVTRRGFTKLKGDPKLSPFSGSSELPALAIANDGNGDYLQYTLNYTPQADPKNPLKMNPEDYIRLQDVGLIPREFPQSQIVPIPSHNGSNWFFVGYSAPRRITTNRDPISVIEPEWAVSYGLNFERTNTPPDNFPNENEFYNVALRTLYAEWLLTNRGVEGCHRDQTLSSCNLERAAILNLILQRTRIKQNRIAENLSYRSVIYGPGIKWNGSSQFMASYEGQIPVEAHERFREFYTTAFWWMPQFSAFSIGFIHPYSMSAGGVNPSWIKHTNPLEDYNFGYPSDHVIKLGNAIFSDTRKTFR